MIPIRRHVLWRAKGQVGLACLVFVLFSYSLGSAFLAGMVPLIARKTGMPDIYVGIILSAASMLTILAAPLWGKLSDRIGRRPILLIAPVLTATGPLCLALLLGMHWEFLTIFQVFVCLLLARSVQATFGSALVPVGQAYVADITGPSRRLSGISLLGVFAGIGSVGGSAIIWASSMDTLALNLSLMSALAALGALAAYLTLHDRAVKTEKTEPVNTGGALLPIWRPITIGLLSAMGFTMIAPILALRVVDKLGFPLEQAMGATGSLLTTMSLSMLLSQLFLASLGKRIQVRKILTTGCILAVVALILFVTSVSLNLTIAAAAVFGTANGLIMISGVSAASVAAKHSAQGQVMGWAAGARALGMTGGPVMGTLIYQVHQDIPFWASLSLFCAALLLQVVPSRSSHSTIS